MDLLDSNHWSDLHALLADLDRDIAALYTEAGVPEMRTRFVGPLLDLHRFGPMTIRQLAARRGVTHSASSQTVAAMRRAGLIEDADSGSDARTRPVTLTARARELAPLLASEWRATEAAVRELDAELPYSMSQVVTDLRELLARRPFTARLRDHLT